MTDLVTTIKGGAGELAVQSKGLLDRVVSPDQRAAIYQRIQTFVEAHPIISAFLVSQIALTGLPLLVFITFTIAVLVFSLIVGLLLGILGALAFTVFAVGFALLFLLPTLFITTTIATFVFLWGLGGYYFLKWFNKASATPQGQAIGDKLNELTGGRLNTVMETAREQQRRLLSEKPSGKKTNGTDEKSDEKSDVMVKTEESENGRFTDDDFDDEKPFVTLPDTPNPVINDSYRLVDRSNKELLPSDMLSI